MTESVASAGRVAAGDPPRTRQVPLAWLGLLPFVVFVSVFLLVPALAVVAGSLGEGDGLRRALREPFRASFVTSLRLAGVTALAGGVIGTALAYAVTVLERPRRLRAIVSAWSGVAANFGGVPLAFAFISALGTQGLVTRVLAELGWDIVGAGFRLSGFAGLALVYLYFQVPLMVLVVGPAIDGLRPTWREAAGILGAGPLRYWVHVAIPILLPSVLGGVLLLFANAFSAYATAYALSGGSANLVPLQIRFVLQGNTITGEGELGNALATWMIVIMAIAIGANLLLQRRSARWLR